MSYYLRAASAPPAFISALFHNRTLSIGQRYRKRQAGILDMGSRHDHFLRGQGTQPDQTTQEGFAMLSRIMPLTNLPEQPAPHSKIDDTPQSVLDHVLLSVGRSVAYGRDQTVFYEGEPCSRLFRVIEGAVRICRFRRDGSRQIEAFHLSGDCFFDIEGDARFTAEASTNTTLFVAEAATVLTPEARFQGITSAIWNLAVQELHRSQNHALLLGYRLAQDRVLTFLEEMAKRLDRVSSIDLPMPRQDIADYLGLTIETVSRSFTGLARSGVISMPRPRSAILKNRMKARVAANFGDPTIPRHSHPFATTQFN